jgi:hypothetical protein
MLDHIQASVGDEITGVGCGGQLHMETSARKKRLPMGRRLDAFQK